MKVIIDTADDIQYKSFYVYALRQHFGKQNVTFCDKPFNSISAKSRNNKSMRFVIKDNSDHIKRYTIDCDDFTAINEELYEWSDVYGSINTNQSDLDCRNKLVQLCPSFAVRYTNRTEAACQAIINLPYCHANIKKYLGKWRRMTKRMPMDAYTPGHADDKYVFHCSTLWKSDEWNRNDETVNLARARFIRLMRKIKDTELEGGLVSYRTDEGAQQFIDCMARPYNSTEYIQKTRRSTFVFNTPAYWGCHGWKLGEYMALGKAILSTPLQNPLPAPLVHGTHIHFVENNEQAIAEGIDYLLYHPDYRHELECNISEYWERYGSPRSTLILLGIK